MHRDYDFLPNILLTLLFYTNWSLFLIKRCYFFKNNWSRRGCSCIDSSSNRATIRHQLGKEGANLPLISSHFAEATFWRNVPLLILFHFFLSEIEVFYHLDFPSRHYDSFKNVKSDLFTICVKDEQRKVTWENFKFFLRLHFLQLSFLFLPPQKLRLRIVDRIFLKWLSYYLSLGAIVRNHAIVLELYPQIRHGENWRGASIRFYLMARLESSLSLSLSFSSKLFSNLDYRSQREPCLMKWFNQR